MPFQFLVLNFSDIILTTLKPQLKNVTAEDVASSLYYFHLNTEDDARFLDEDPPADVEETTTFKEKSLPRKPLPDSARSSLDLNRQMTSVSLSAGGASGIPRRKPVTTGPTLPVSLQQPDQGVRNISRRPLGPRPMVSEPPSARESLPGVENRPWTSISQSQDGASTSRTSFEIAMSPQSKDMPISKKRFDDDKAFSITIIRRDPSSGAQWNIGMVSGHSASNEPNHGITSPQKKPKKGNVDISIHLSTPGYGPFRNPVPAGNAATSITGAAIRSGDGLNMDQPETPTASNWSFHRLVKMEGSSFWGRPSIQHRRTLSDISGKHITHRRSSSNSSDAGLGDLPRDLHDNGSDFRESQSKGYMFVSPWGGRCKFSTRGNGRSLRCMHTLPAPVSASSTTESTSFQRSSEPVSELRFNLPSATLFSSSTSKSATKKSSVVLGSPNFSNLRKKLSPQKTQPLLPSRPHPTSYAAMYPSDGEDAPPPPPRSYHITDSSEGEAPSPLPMKTHLFPYSTNTTHEELDDDDPPLDLSIGQEKAGGGNRGKRAKLGKLVIHHEGFKMLDLVVAANIGVWWSVWESILH